MNASTSKLGIGMTPVFQLDMYNSGTGCVMKCNSASGDSILYLFSGSLGRATLKSNAGGLFTIYSSSNGTAQQMKFQVSSGITCCTMNVDGSCSTNNTWTGPQFTSTSDTSLKNDQQPVSQEDIRQVFDGLSTKTFVRNDIPEELASGTRRVGFIAQELQAVLPPAFQNLVVTAPNYRDSGKDILAIDYGVLTSVLWEVVKGQDAKLKSQEAAIEGLMARLAALESRLQ
jgi:hypothetical protein